jgi:hypothetical protein
VTVKTRTLAFPLGHPEGQVIHASSEGAAGVIAAKLTDFINLVVTYPYWQSLISGDLGAMRAAVPEEEEMALEDQPELATWRDSLRAAFRLPSPASKTADPLKALHHALALNAGLVVRVTTDPASSYRVRSLVA